MDAAMPWAQQPNHHQVLDEFNKWIENQTVASYNTTNGQRDVRGFVPEGRAKLHLSKESCAKLVRILLVVLNEQHRQNLDVSPREIAENCSKVFCILFLIGRASYIGVFVRHASLFDERLPFYKGHPPPEFPSEPGFYDAFFEAQWRFCALKMRPHGDLSINNETILPFMEMEHLGAGRTGTVYKIKVHEDHDELQTTGSDNDHLRSVGHRCYAIKTLRRADAQESYDREAKAFKRVAEDGMRSTPGMIQFFCGFKYGDTFNLVLEFADQGNFANFLRNHDPPKGAANINDFWKALLQTVAAVSTIHQHRITQGTPGPDMIMSGWHQDIKPENIMVFSNGNREAYPFSFKLADLGLAHFKSTMDGAPARAFDAFGTRAYGAPECLSWRGFFPFQDNLIFNAVDICSLGCIISEVAVWIARGWSGLSTYRHNRAAATNKLVDFTGGDCFHDGTHKLTAVDDAHNDVREVLIIPADFTTGRVLEGMVEEMLHSIPTERPTAMKLHQKAQQLLQSATHAIEAHRRRHEDRPGLRTGHQGLPRPSSGDTFDPHHSSPRGYTQNSIASAGGSPTESLPPGDHQRYSSMDESYIDDEHNLGMPQSPATSGPVVAARGSLSNSNRPSTVGEGTRQPFQSPAVRPQTSGHHSQSVLATPNTNVKYVCSMPEAFEWYNRRKYSGSSKERLPHHELMSDLKGRDHIFFVDDSRSMESHWTSLTKVLRLLAYITKEMDPNGLELYLLSTGQLITSKKSRKFYDTVREHKPGAITNLNGIFDREIRRYGEEIDRWRKHTLPFKREPPRQRSVYVLTDGVWEGAEDSQGHDCIRDLVRRLQAAHLPRQQVGIQFISFGADFEGLGRLDRLDKLAHLDPTDRLPLDIVDTEPSDGNLWKMLLGAINTKFDHD